tara:strand:+ start:438 stop:569 length:132 start_codon:yes stop_codon:yes gene_type:complete
MPGAYTAISSSLFEFVERFEPTQTADALLAQNSVSKGISSRAC